LNWTKFYYKNDLEDFSRDALQYVKNMEEQFKLKEGISQFTKNLIIHCINMIDASTVDDFFNEFIN